MESINLNNYEAYFLDFLEGTLSVADEEAMYLFLDAHPELKTEFVDLTGMSMDDLRLQVKDSSNISKASLKADPTIISPFTVDQWMVDSVENQLNEKQNAQLLNYIAKHQLESKFMAYQAAVLSPKATDVFGNKSNLKRKPVTVIPMWAKVGSAAAAVALILFLINPDETQNELANDNPSTSITTSSSDFRNFQAALPRNIELNSSNDTKNDQAVFNQVRLDDIVREEKIEQVDTAKVIIPNHDLPDDIVEQKVIDTSKTHIEKQIPDQVDENIAVIEKADGNKTVEEEPYRIFTNAASNVTNRQVSFTRTLNTESEEYVAYHFKIGKFEFDRKKRSK